MYAFVKVYASEYIVSRNATGKYTLIDSEELLSDDVKFCWLRSDDANSLVYRLNDDAASFFKNSGGYACGHYDEIRLVSDDVFNGWFEERQTEKADAESGVGF